MSLVVFPGVAVIALGGFCFSEVFGGPVFSVVFGGSVFFVALDVPGFGSSRLHHAARPLRLQPGRLAIESGALTSRLKTFTRLKPNAGCPLALPTQLPEKKETDGVYTVSSPKPAGRICEGPV